MFDWLVNVVRKSNLLNQPEYSDYLDFLIEVLNVIAQSDGKSEVVYPLLEANQDKLNDNLIQVLQQIVTAAFEQGEIEQKQNLAEIVFKFSSLIQQFPLGIRANNVEIAINGYQVILKFYPREAYLYEWARMKNNLGNAYCTRIKGEQAENLETAITYYQESLKVRTFEAYPDDWAMTQGNLAVAYRMRIRGEKAENLETAIATNQEVLKVYTFEAYPDDWARTQNNLGNAYCTRIEGERAENLETAITYYRESLKVYTFEAYPNDWANTQNNLANAYSEKIKGDRVENLETAIACYLESLKVYTFKDFPYGWARTQYNLANAYRDRIRGEQAENLETAISYLQESLKVFAFEAYPYEWAITQNNLGIAYRNRNRRGERAENLETAILYFQESLKVYTFKDFPYEWARSQGNLANVYLERIKGEQAENLETAITYYRESFKVFTFEAYPYEWSLVQNNLGNAYRDRIFGDRKENIKTAISYYQAALTINAPTANPIRCLETSSDLGNLAFGESKWQLAIDAYSQAIEAVETSRSWSTSDDRRREIIEQAINVYHNIVQAYINIGQIDKAIEYTERSRSRTLVDLMASNDLYGDGEIPPQVKEFLRQFVQLQQKIDSERLRTQKDNQSNRPQDNSRAAWKAYNDTISNLETQKLQIWQEIRKLDPILAGEIRIDTPDFTSIQKLIDDSETAIISFYTTSQDTHIFILFKDRSSQLHTCLGQGLETLQNWINESWLLPYSNINKAEEKEQQRLRKEWRDRIEPFLAELSQRLQINEVITQYLDDIKELIIIPHLYLHQIPFAALPIPDTDSPPIQAGLGERLSARFHIRHIPSCQILQFCQERPFDLAQTSKIGTVEDADGSLPGASLEGEKIAQLFNIPDHQRLKGSTQATVRNYRQLAKQVNILHSSHHASSRLDKPLESILVLGDGTITLGELLTPGWRLFNLRDVFLSCCETNLGKSEIADDIFTLATGFLCAGAKSVVSTLWAVDDLSTALFCIFYYQFRQEGVSRPQAVCKAQEKLRTMTGETFAREYQPELYAHLHQQYKQIETERKPVRKKRQKLAELAKDTLEYKQLFLEEKRLKGIAEYLWNLKEKTLQDYCQQQLPFEHPVYWAGFISQGIH